MGGLPGGLPEGPCLSPSPPGMKVEEMGENGENGEDEGIERIEGLRGGLRRVRARILGLERMWWIGEVGRRGKWWVLRGWRGAWRGVISGT